MNNCELCSGTGVLRLMEEIDRNYEPTGQIVAVPPDVSDGKAKDLYPYPQWAMAAAECVCSRKKRAISRVEFALSQGRIDNKVVNSTWLYYQADTMKYAHHAIEVAQRLVSADDVDGKSGLLFVGPKGTGKSSLAYLTMRDRANAGCLVEWVRFPTLIDEIRWTYQPGNTAQSVMDLKTQIQRARFLVIDELGSITKAQRVDASQLWAEDAVQTLQAIMDIRHNLHLPTIITSNLSMTQLVNQFGEPVMSRIRGLCHVVPMDSSVDLRITS